MKWVFILIGSVLLLGRGNAQEKCPVEVKILLSSPLAEPVITSFGFKKKTSGLVYFFDTDSLELLSQGVIVRVRQGAGNDLTIKLRSPKGKRSDRRSQLAEQFPCEIDRTPAEAYTSYAIARKYESEKAPQIGTEIYTLLNASQKQLLGVAGVFINWARVVRVANINSTKWETDAHSPYGKLALELWEWPAGKILELSAKSAPTAGKSKYSELVRLLEMKGISVNATQETKTTTVLKTFATRPSRS